MDRRTSQEFINNNFSFFGNFPKTVIFGWGTLSFYCGWVRPMPRTMPTLFFVAGRPGNYNWSNGALNNRGTNGNFWSSVGYSGTNAHNFNFNSSNFNPQNGNNKGNGFSVRCLELPP